MSNLVVAVTLVDGQPRVSSLDIADKFSKPHNDVLKIIRRIISDLPVDFGQGNFSQSSYRNGQGKEQPCYQLTRDAFSLLAMGFTGKKALEWKVKYIEAFNAMERALHHNAIPLEAASALPASLQSELHALVDAKLSAFPRAIQGRARSEIWTRFNRHFKIARYAQLPPARMPEARDYLIEMEVRALASLPASAPLPAPKQDNVPAWDEMPVPADLDKRRARICRELYELQEKFGMLVNDIRICLNPGGRLLRLPPELDNAYETLDALNRVATGGAYTARQAIYSAYQIGKGLKFV